MMRSLRLRSPWSLWSSLKRQWRLLRLMTCSLMYNDHMSFTYTMDTMLSPLVFFMERMSKSLGPLLFFIVLLLHLVVVVTSYVIGLPFYLEHYSFSHVFMLFLMGNWLLLNVLFHMAMVRVRGPGHPPRPLPLGVGVVNVCKTCIKPKVARSHHCSICQRCVLKMDHHCPWLNSCIGHYNHKHFLLYVFYTVLGCLFLVFFGFNVLADELYRDDKSNLPITFRVLRVLIVSRRSLILLQTFLALGSLLFLSVLLVWHLRLVSRGETSIEEHINQAEVAKNKGYVNIYDLGLINNWKHFFNVDNLSGLVLNVIIPNARPPRGNGLSWEINSTHSTHCHQSTLQIKVA